MPTAMPSNTIPCARCGAPCQLAPAATDRPGIAILRGKSQPKGRGVCPSCNVTAFLQDPSLPMVHIFGGMDAAKRAMTLGLPFIQAQLAQIIASQPGGVGLDLSTVSWERVNTNWDLPHPPGTWGMRRPKSEPYREPPLLGGGAGMQTTLDQVLPGAKVISESPGSVTIRAPLHGPYGRRPTDEDGEPN